MNVNTEYTEILEMLKEMVLVAQEIDGDESFPMDPLDRAIELLVKLDEY